MPVVLLSFHSFQEKHMELVRKIGYNEHLQRDFSYWWMTNRSNTFPLNESNPSYILMQGVLISLQRIDNFLIGLLSPSPILP